MDDLGVPRYPHFRKPPYVDLKVVIFGKMVNTGALENHWKILDIYIYTYISLVPYNIIYGIIWKHVGNA